MRLWDGNEYCPRCVEQAEVELLKYAHGHETLDEAVQLYPRHVFWANALVSAGATLLACSFAALVAISADVDVWLAVAAIFVLMVPLSILHTAGSVSYINSTKMYVSACNGYLVISIDGTTNRFRLQDCAWSQGTVAEMSVFGPRIMLPWRPRAIVVDTPLKAGDRLKTIAVGLTPELFLVWEGFLSIADVPKRKYLANSILEWKKRRKQKKRSSAQTGKGVKQEKGSGLKNTAQS